MFASGDVTVIQGTPFDTLQLQPINVVTDTLLFVAAKPYDAPDGASANEQAAPACVAVKLMPAMLNVPARASAVGFASTRYVSVPLFVAPVAERISIHAFVFDTLHTQPTSVVTPTELVSTPAPCAALFVARAYVQAAPDCVMVNVWSATVTVPVRASAVTF